MLSAAGLITTDVLLGWPDRAMEMRKLMLARAESSAHPFSRLFGIVLADWIV
jgi:hypothetical protein